MENNVITQTYYISTGRLDARYTLRFCRVANGYFIDHYICNLADSEDKARAKAKDYFDRLKERIGDSVNFIMEFDDDIGPKRERKGKLSANQTEWLRNIENGFFPFGKNRGKKINEVEDSYIMYFADKANSDDVITSALAAACMGVALERDLITKREQMKEEKKAKDMLSEYIGEVGQRLDFSGTIVYSFYKEEHGFYINRILCDNNIVVYIGKQFGEKGDEVNFKATIKRHSEYNGVKSTQINRPTKKT